jgi:hypothetical protein
MLPHPSRTSRVRRPLSSRPSPEALEGRVVLSWAGTPPPAVAPPPAAVAVALNAQGDASGTAAISSGEVDYYALVAPTTGSYRITARTPTSNLDTVLGVFDAAGNRVAYNDDLSPSNRDSLLNVGLVAGNRYYFGITNYSGTRNGAYTWGVDGPAGTAPADDRYEENDALAQATALGGLTTPTTLDGLVLADAADWFRFDTAATGGAGDSVAIAFQNAQGDLGLELYDGAGALLTTANAAGNVETVSLGGLGAGTYFARVFGTAGATNPAYTLTVAPPALGTPVPGAFDIVIRSSGLSASQQLVFDRAAARWEQVIVGDLPNATYNGLAVDDLLIDASSVAIDGVNGILGQAGPDSVRGGTYLPVHGTMQFDTADLASMEANNTLYEVILHEMGHVLGIGTIWQYRGLLTGAGTADPRFVGARAVAEYNAMFGTNAAGVPVEGTPAPQGTRDGHWRESVFGNELMTGYIAAANNPLSRLTVASLADLGYTVNLAAADPYTPTGAAALRSSGATTAGAGLAWGGATPAARAPHAAATVAGMADPTATLTPPRRSPYARTASAWARGALA